MNEGKPCPKRGSTGDCAPSSYRQRDDFDVAYITSKYCDSEKTAKPKHLQISSKMIEFRKRKTK